ncbi:hypothetical protein [Photobacterium halotolerans]|uniref:Uncharacterized protein n=1 Tax=Photobacterium halotolerans TaxID=265726 RepID=A0A0F5VGU5_9GAMM|nr:hypothetical protein [Photobacterium halotolerans]KKD01401.1 hypothetical protein KY46_00795 [Photobacterium halotolerans]
MHQNVFDKPGVKDLKKQHQIQDELNRSIMQDKGDLLELCMCCHKIGIIRFNPETKAYHCIQCGGEWTPTKLSDYFTL